jgi:peptidoglycan/xylan/chitin deacetylase (PgdA/CDA1 family)
MIVSVVLHHNGSVATSGYTLNNSSVPGLRAWQQPIVSLAFGDGWQSAYEEASPMLGQFKLPATFYINPGTIDTRHFISDDQIKDLAGNGNEVTSEGFDRIDLTSLDSTHLQAELKNSYELLRTNFGEKSLDFAAPFGNVDPQVDYYARKIYRSELGNATGINTPQTFDPYNLKVTYITANTTTAELQTLLKQVKNEKGWLILVYHQVTNKPFDGAPAVSTAAFLQQLKTIQQSGIGVDTVAAAVSSLEQQTAQAAAGTHRTAANGTHLQRPTVIPNTGAGNMIDLFLTAAVGGAGIHSLLSSWLAHRNK